MVLLPSKYLECRVTNSLARFPNSDVYSVLLMFLLILKQQPQTVLLHIVSIHMSNV